MSRVRSIKLGHLDRWFITIGAALFTFVVLYVYKAYDIQQGVSASGHTLLVRAGYFALGSFGAFFINEFLIRDHVLAPESSRTRFFIFRIWEIFFGANVTFILFNVFWNWDELYWFGYFLLLFEYTFIVIIPVVMTGLIFRRPTSEFVPEMVDFFAENKKSKISILSNALLYIKSEDNYVELFYLSKDIVKSELLRNSLKAIEDSFANSGHLVRCHRSYMINPAQIVKVVDKKPQPVIDLGHSITIPVSGKYLDSMKALELIG